VRQALALLERSPARSAAVANGKNRKNENNHRSIEPMNRKQLLIGTGTLVGIATLALAHHVPVGLSHVAGTEILREVIFFTQTGNFGVPAYHIGANEAPDHHDAVGITSGDSFTVMDQGGISQTIVLEAADFTDISTAVTEEVIDVINSKATLFQGVEHNGFVVLHGVQGGSSASLTVTDGSGSPLGKLGVLDGFALGGGDLELTLSIPDPNLNLAGKPYIVLASTTPGSFSLQGKTVPIGRDPVFFQFFSAVQNGAVPGFKGVLNGTSDASATLTAAQFAAGFQGNFPDKMYFAYLVFDPARQVAYVSNSFTVDFR
jgi:hypothetical protein